MNENEEKVTPFKVGEQVVAKRFDTIVGQPPFAEEMNKYCGIAGKIEDVGERKAAGWFKVRYPDGNFWWWPLSALTRASEAKPTASDVGNPPPMSNKKIPMSEIRNEVRELAVAWCEVNGRDWIGDKYKLASDVQNYADWYAASLIAAKDKQIAELQAKVEQLKGREI